MKQKNINWQKALRKGFNPPLQSRSKQLPEDNAKIVINSLLAKHFTMTDLETAAAKHIRSLSERNVAGCHFYMCLVAFLIAHRETIGAEHLEGALNPLRALPPLGDKDFTIDIASGILIGVRTAKGLPEAKSALSMMVATAVSAEAIRAIESQLMQNVTASDATEALDIFITRAVDALLACMLCDSTDEEFPLPLSVLDDNKQGHRFCVLFYTRWIAERKKLGENWIDRIDRLLCCRMGSILFLSDLFRMNSDRFAVLVGVCCDEKLDLQEIVSLLQAMHDKGFLPDDVLHEWISRFSRIEHASPPGTLSAFRRVLEDFRKQEREALRAEHGALARERTAEAAELLAQREADLRHEGAVRILTRLERAIAEGRDGGAAAREELEAAAAAAHKLKLGDSAKAEFRTQLSACLAQADEMLGRWLEAKARKPKAQASNAQPLAEAHLDPDAQRLADAHLDPDAQPLAEAHLDPEAQPLAEAHLDPDAGLAHPEPEAETPALNRHARRRLRKQTEAQAKETAVAKAEAEAARRERVRLREAAPRLFASQPESPRNQREAIRFPEPKPPAPTATRCREVVPAASAMRAAAERRNLATRIEENSVALALNVSRVDTDEAQVDSPV
jgi:hypothetical protein